MDRVTERYESPDKVLTFAVIESETGDVALGFLAPGTEPRLFGHTHPEIERARWQVSEEEGVKSYLDDVVLNRRVIAISRLKGEITDVWLPERFDDIFDASPEEVIELRYWDGTSWSPS